MILLHKSQTDESTQNGELDTLFTAFIATIQKIIPYALGEHDPGSAQDWRTSNDFCSPATKQCTCGHIVGIQLPEVLFFRPLPTSWGAGFSL